MIEQRTMKRLDENTVVVDGLVWTTVHDKAQKFKNPDTGGWLLNIKIDGQSYYPAAVHKGSKTPYILIKEQ